MSCTFLGDITITSSSAAPRKLPFRFSVDGEKWSARVDYGTNNYQLAGFDGSKSGMALIDPKPDPWHPEHPMCAAEIYNSSYPAGADPAIRLAWLAFAAAPFFRSAESDHFTAPWDMGLMRPEAHAIRISRVELIPGSPDLPLRINMVISTQRLLRDVANVPNLSPFVSAQEIEKAMRPLRLYNGRLCARYEVLSTTNFQGQLLPLSFELSLIDYTFPFGRRIPARFRGTVHAITTNVPRTFLPNVGWTIAAQDYRFVDRTGRIDRILTRVRNGVWPEKDNPELQESFRSLQAERQGVAEKTP